MADEVGSTGTLPDGLREFLAYHRRMLILLTAVSASVSLGLLLLAHGDYALFGGFVAGASAQLLKFGILDVGVVKSMADHQGDAPMRQVKSRYGTLALFAVAIIVTIKFGFNVWAFAAGVVLPRVIFLADTFLRPNLFAKSRSSFTVEKGKDA
ncbi:MAG: hypothetical protein LBT97_05090 [Planctomycetota bacterium]|nr:hypothetical protein [Planctomycetota bacterium]